MDLNWRDYRALRATGDAERPRLVLGGASTASILVVVVIRRDSASGWLVLGRSGWQGQPLTCSLEMDNSNILLLYIVGALWPALAKCIILMNTVGFVIPEYSSLLFSKERDISGTAWFGARISSHQKRWA
ncbi:hypothetical protein Dimus_013125 [Dionaea muscipula]